MKTQQSPSYRDFVIGKKKVEINVGVNIMIALQRVAVGTVPEGPDPRAVLNGVPVMDGLDGGDELPCVLPPRPGADRQD